jgi:hypothetical protein
MRRNKEKAPSNVDGQRDETPVGQIATWPGQFAHSPSFAVSNQK